MKLLLAESTGFSPRALDLLRSRADVTCADLDRPELLAAVTDADVLWVRLRNVIDTEVMNAAPQLRWIVTNTTGLNHLDLEAAAKRNIAVLSLRGEADFLQEIRATAELTLGLLLALVRRIDPAAEQVRQGHWNRYPFKGHDLFEKTAGIVGYGRLGRIVGGYLQALGMRLLATTRDPDPTAVAAGVTLVSLEQLLAESDVVSLHVNLTDETRGMFGRKQIEAMKPGSWFINTARGELVDEAALLAALESGRLAGAALDVIAGEHDREFDGHPLVEYARQHDNLLITPHIGGYTHESLEKTEMFLAEKLLNAIASAHEK